MNTKLLFFVGKGGVGKSTTSAATAVYLSTKGIDTLLVSMDPAHNLRDIFEVECSEKPMELCKNLEVKEVDEGFWISKYLKKTVDNLKNTYTYQSAFNLDHHFKVLRHSPGIEEYALLLAFQNIIQTHNDKEYIIFDMAPTAVTLRFFALPFVTLVWLEELLKLRNKIVEKKEIITKIKIGKKEIERDRVKKKLESMIVDYSMLQDIFLSDAIEINLVMNEDRLSFSESVRIKNRLDDLKIGVNRIVMNKAVEAFDIKPIVQEFGIDNFRIFPRSKKPLSGLASIREYLEIYQNIFNL
jgi:arsenite-transporting ATPase